METNVHIQMQICEHALCNSLYKQQLHKPRGTWLNSCLNVCGLPSKQKKTHLYNGIKFETRSVKYVNSLRRRLKKFSCKNIHTYECIHTTNIHDVTTFFLLLSRISVSIGSKM